MPPNHYTSGVVFLLHQAYELLLLEPIMLTPSKKLKSLDHILTAIFIIITLYLFQINQITPSLLITSLLMLLHNHYGGNYKETYPNSEKFKFLRNLFTILLLVSLYIFINNYQIFYLFYIVCTLFIISGVFHYKYLRCNEELVNKYGKTFIFFAHLYDTSTLTLYKDEWLSQKTANILYYPLSPLSSPQH